MRKEEVMLIEMNVSAQKISDQFVTAFEGGSNYWLFTARLMKADNRPTETPWYSDPKVFEKRFEIELGYDDPKGYEGEGKGLKLITHVDVRHGLDVMRRDYPKHFAAVMDETATPTPLTRSCSAPCSVRSSTVRPGHPVMTLR
jgi:hypothetical protein